MEVLVGVGCDQPTCTNFGIISRRDLLLINSIVEIVGRIYEGARQSS